VGSMGKPTEDRDLLRSRRLLERRERRLAESTEALAERERQLAAETELRLAAERSAMLLLEREHELISLREQSESSRRALEASAGLVAEREREILMQRGELERLRRELRALELQLERSRATPPSLDESRGSLPIRLRAAVIGRLGLAHGQATPFISGSHSLRWPGRRCRLPG